MYIKQDTKYFLYLYILDIIAMWVCFFTAFYLRFFSFAQIHSIYFRFFFVISVCILIADITTKNFYGFFERGYLKEFMAVCKCTFFVWIFFLLYSFVLKETAIYSRLFISFCVTLNVIIIYLFRIIFKRCINKFYRKGNNASKVVLVTTNDYIQTLTENFSALDVRDYWVSHIAVIDQNRVGQTVNGFAITANAQNLFDIIQTEVIDEAFLYLSPQDSTLAYYISAFQTMGITLHIALESLNMSLPNARIENFINSTVITTSENIISHFQLIQKRTLDIVGACVGLIITGMIGIVLIPAICLESKGSPIYSQIRIGRNGRKFKMYKFRSMYQDADARKVDLAAQNEMNGLMFKIKVDPRVTKVGKFIRKTSLDELPQFWNVLKGDMSLVGTRPPTLDEFERYSPHHKSRLSFKPGITGLWQTSGRNEITDFEDVVALDTKYIENWNFSWDIKILFYTVIHLFKGKGAS
ncbi:MAG: sugar transferase [Oscillospiraceae bacterium]|nr:sugar transferase [Oscillospiraceae bacterium]